MIPPETIPSKASWCLLAVHSATTASPLTKLRMRRPFSLAGPHPKQELPGAYVSWRLGPSVADGWSLMLAPSFRGPRAPIRTA
jgi:hypothetical protein